MSRRKIAAGNWKLNLSFEEAMQLAKSIADEEIPEGVEVVLAAPFPYLKSLRDLTMSIDKLHIAAQNCSEHAKGAYTGEVSVAMLDSIQITHVLVGHSERREYFEDTSEVLSKKLERAFENGLVPIYCCGEPLAIRKDGTHVAFVKKQLEETIFKLERENFSKLILAYEPIWAIGTGETASPEQAQEMHAAIRSVIADKYDTALAESIPILYGGSVKPANAKEIFSQSDVDGGLVGGASLKAESFSEIIKSF